VRFTALIDDPLLPKLLREFHDALATEKTDRAGIADELTGKARASWSPARQSDASGLAAEFERDSAVRARERRDQAVT